MATQSVERPEQASEADPSTVVISPKEATLAPYPRPYSSVKEADNAERQIETIAPAALVTPEAASLTRNGLLMVVGRRVVAFHDWLFGPATSQLDRTRSVSVMARNDWTNY